MSEHRLLSHMRLLARMASDERALAKLGIVSSYDPNTYSAKVYLQPTNVETGWLPVSTLWAGNGWGMFCPPTAGDQVTIVFEDGALEAGVIVTGLFSDTDRPLPVPSGEFWLVHKDGAYLKLTNDGGIQSKGAWTHDGAFSATGEVTAKSSGAAIALSAHRHPLTGGPETGAPLPS